MPQQHVDLYRKALLRKRMLRWAPDGPVYVPFIGDGDLAVDLYGDRQIYGADIDPDRTAVASYRLPAAEIRTADCEQWVFEGLRDPIALADFDAYGNPYRAFNAFWRRAPKADRLVCFFTDGQGINIEFKGRWNHPDGTECFAPGFVVGKAAGDVNYRRRVYAFWWSQTVEPWFREVTEGWRVLDRIRYVRGIMLYWGAAIERT